MEKYEKTITGKTFSPLYDEVEDRIRLTINYQDIENRIDFVITRNLIISWIPAINGFIDKYYNDDLAENITSIEIESDIKDVIKQSTNKQQLKLTDNSDLELLKTEDVLLERIDLRYNVNSRNTTLILFSKNIMVKSILDYNNLIKIMGTIKNTIPNFKWGLSRSFIYD